MVPIPVLDIVLGLVGALWLLVGLAIVVHRLRQRHRARRAASVRRRLTATGSASGDLSRVVRRLTLEDFQLLAFDGLSRTVVADLAREVRRHRGGDRLRRLADGTAGADEWKRIAALQVLASDHDPDADLLLDRALRSGSPRLAAAAVRLLARRDDASAAELLVLALADGCYVRSRVAAALERMSAFDAGLIGTLLDGADSSVRFWGLRLVARRRAREWAPRVRALATDPEPLVRRAAVEALGIVGEPGDERLLLARFQDPIGFVRAHAARAAVALADAAAIDGLTRLLGDREWIVRTAARDALVALGDTARPALVQALWLADRFAAHAAADALYRTGTMAGAARRVVRDAAGAGDLVPLVARFFEVGERHLRQALLSRFDDRERERLLERAGLPASMAA